MMSEKAPPPLGAAPAQVPGQYPQYQQQGYPQQYQAPAYGQPAGQQYQPPPGGPAPYGHQTPPPGGAPYGQQASPPPQPYPGQQPQYGQYPQPPPQAAQNPYAQQAQAPQPYGGPQPYPAMVVQQPLPVIGMSIPSAGGNRNVKNLPRDATGKREWSFGLCDCFSDCGTCMFGWCCPCMLYAQVKQRLDYLNMYAKPDPARGGSGVDVNCMVWCLVHSVTGCGFILQSMNRGQLRNRYLIDGNGCGDFCTACWCTPCELVQEHRELDLEEATLRM